MHIPNKTSHSAFWTRFASSIGSLNVAKSTDLSFSISASVLWRINSGLLLHFTVTYFPSGISLNLTSILAKANTSADGATLATISRTIALAPYAVAKPIP